MNPLTWMKTHPKVTALIGAAAVGAGTYYGVPPEVSKGVLKTICGAVGAC